MAVIFKAIYNTLYPLKSLILIAPPGGESFGLEKFRQHGEKIIVIKSLVKRFGERMVLDNVSLAIEKGKTTVIIGPSGCGKTVLLKHMVLLLRPTSGEIYFKEQRIDTLRG